jgi:lipopolysaccharide export system permease protein
MEDVHVRRPPSLPCSFHVATLCRMRLLDRYLLRELLIPLGYCLAGFLIFYSAFDLIFSLDSLQKLKLHFGDYVAYYLWTLPEMVVTVMPIGLLLAMLYALTNMARYNELTAMRAAGIALWRLMLPYMTVGLGIGFLVLIVNELWVPQSILRAEEIKQRRVAPVQSRVWHGPLKFRNETENRSWDVKNFNLKTSEVIRPSIAWESADGGHHDLFAESGIFSNGVWNFFKVQKWDTDPGARFAKPLSNDVFTADFSETPELIKSDIKINSLKLDQAAKRPQLSITEIRNYERLHPRVERDRRAILESQKQGRYAEPVKCLMVVLIAIPFGARSGRRNVFVGVAASIFICFGYFILQKICLGLGTADILPAALSAWLPNIVFGTVGLVMTLRVR